MNFPLASAAVIGFYLATPARLKQPEPGPTKRPEPGPGAFVRLPFEAWVKLPPHPRLCADTSRWKALKTQVESDPVSGRKFALIRGGPRVC